MSSASGDTETGPRASTESSPSALGAVDTGGTVESRGGGEAPTAAESGSLPPGAVLGRYRVVRMVGSGGMGEVYAATDIDLDRRVALKILRGGRGHRDAAQRLLREARAMARVVHPNVMTVHEVGSERGVDYVVMEFVEGIDLRQWAETRPGWREVVAAFVAAGRGVAAAHAAGMVHRDLKPANILRARDGRVLVTDFGLVRLQPERDEGSVVGDAQCVPDAPELTEVGVFLGTPAYAAPEQFSGITTASSDQYSLCASLYAVLFGRPPHGGRPSAAPAGRRGAPPAGGGCPRWLWTVIARGLEPDPAERYPSVDALVAALSRRTRRRSATLGVAAGAFGLAGLWAVYAAQDPAADACRPAEVLRDWPDARRRLVELDWDGSLRSAVPAFERLTARMDAYAAAWSDSWRDACEATKTRHVQSESVMRARMECLRHREQRVHAMLEVLAAPQPRTIVWAQQAALALPAVAACNDVSDELSLPEPDPSVAEAVEAIRRRVVAIEVGLPTLPLDEVVERSRSLVDDARATRFAPVLAEALLARGQALNAAERPRDARIVFEEAALVAEESGHRRAYAHAMVALVGIDTVLWPGAQRLEARVRRARIAVAGYGYEGLDSDLDQAEAEALRRAGDLEAAQQRLRDVIARRRSTTSPIPERIADSERRLGAVLGELGRSEEATVVLRSALDRLLEAHGGETHDSAEVRSGLADELRQQGRWHAARVHTLAIQAYLATAAGRSQVDAIFEPWSERIERDRDRSTEIHVVDADGRARAGAEVVVGRTIEGDGAYVAAGGLAWWVQSGASRGLTDERGHTTLRHSSDAVWLIAEHEGGRSWPVRIDKAQRSPVEVRLRPWAALEGVVEVSAPGVDRTKIHVFPRDLAAGRQVEFLLSADADGRFSAPRLAAGAYIVGVQIQWRDGTRLVHRVDHVVSERAVEPVQLEIQVAPTTLRLQLSSVTPEPAGEAFVFVVTGSVEVTSVATLDIAMVQAAAAGPMALGATRGGVLLLRGLPLGRYTVCVLPSTNADDDPQAQMVEILREEDTPVQCSPIELTAPAQRLDIEASPTRFHFPDAP